MSSILLSSKPNERACKGHLESFYSASHPPQHNVEREIKDIAPGDMEDKDINVLGDNETDSREVMTCEKK